MKNLVRRITMAVLLLSAGFSYAQTWNTVGGGIPGSWVFYEIEMASTEASGNIYVGYTYTDYSAPPFVSTTTVKKWDGLSWTTYPPITDNTFFIKDIEVIGSSIYLIGGSASTAFYEFNGTVWSAKAPPAYNGNTRTSEVVNGELLVGGDFTATGIEDIFSYDGTNFNAYPAMPSGIGTVTDIHEFNGDLYLSLNGLSGNNPNALINLNSSGTGWDQPAHFLQGTSTTWNEYKIFDFQNKLYVADEDYHSAVFEVSSDTLFWKGALQHNVIDFEEYNGEMYLAGDTTHFSTGPNRITKFDGTGLVPILGAPSSIAGVDTLNSELYLFSKTTVNLNGITYNRAFRTQANFSLLTGETYLDGNADCFKNTSEANIGNALLSLNGQIVTLSGQNGQYTIALSQGTYSLDTVYIPFGGMKNTVLNCTLPGNITVGLNQTIVQDIGFSNSVPTDMRVILTPYLGWGARLFFADAYDVQVTNTGNSTQTTATLNVELPQSMNYISSNPLPASVSGSVLTYNFLNMQPLETRRIKIVAQADTGSNSLGDTLNWVAAFDPISGDADLSDNVDSLTQIIVGPYDPNDKQVSDQQIVPGTHKVDYHIRFQNTGTDTAVKVTIVDTLDLTLPVTKIVINSASHPFNLSVVNNILVWEFNNIMLPDSGADYLGSQGYVRFSAGINPALGIGDTIDNDAEIYFDYQPPVHTNHAKTAIVGNISLVEQPVGKTFLEVYPNPARSEIHLLNTSGEAADIRLIDAAGKLIDELNIRPGEKTTYPVYKLNPGVYFLKSDNSVHQLVITH